MQRPSIEGQLRLVLGIFRAASFLSAVIFFPDRDVKRVNSQIQSKSKYGQASVINAREFRFDFGILASQLSEKKPKIRLKKRLKY